MNRNKKIDEMARAMCLQREHCTAKSCTGVNCETTWLAKALYNAGYRKASDIFEEIEKHSEVALMNGHIETPILCIGFGVFAELKKKYESEKK